MGSLNLLVDWTQHIPCNDDFVVPLRCRPTFLDYTTFEMATRLGRLTANPTNYTDKEGGIYYRSTNQRLYYRNATVWVPLGLGDGDVIFDPVGTAQQDNGVARWSVTSKYIQGSIATLDDSGNFFTPGKYESQNNTLVAAAFDAHNSDFSSQWYVDHKGLQTWLSSGAPLATWGLITTNIIGSARNDMQIALTNGDSRISAQRLLAGKGNAQSQKDFRSVITGKTIGTWNYPGAADSSEIQFFNEIVPIGGLTPGDVLHLKLLFQTSNSASTKFIKFYFGGIGSPNSAGLGVVGGSVLFVHVDMYLVALSGGGYTADVMAVQQGAFSGTLDPHSYNGTFNFSTNALDIAVVGFCGITAGPYAADSIIVNGGFVEYLNL